jgi:hypothetical protein
VVDAALFLASAALALRIGQEATARGFGRAATA